MPQPTRNHLARPHLPPTVHLPRRRDQVLAAATVVLALVALVLTVAGAYDVGAVVALACVLVGGWSQMVSETTAERFETVTATVAGAVLLATCLAYGSGVWT